MVADDWLLSFLGETLKFRTKLKHCIPGGWRIVIVNMNIVHRLRVQRFSDCICQDM